MKRVERTMIIEAPVENVFSYLSDPNNLLEIWPSLIEVTNVKRLEDGGYSYDWVYKMAGMRYKGHAESIEFIKNQRVVESNTGGIEATITWDFEQHGDETIMHFTNDYAVPTSLLGRMAEPIISRINEHEADVFIANLKARMTADVPVSR